jgi:hypothetical protein
MDHDDGHRSITRKTFAIIFGFGAVLFLGLAGYKALTEGSWDVWLIVMALLAAVLSVGIAAGKIRGL